MKTYEKPRLMFLSLSGNDRLCGDCANGNVLYQNPDMAALMMDMYQIPDRTGNGPSRDDFVGLFGNTELECSNKLDGYCKFSSTAERAIIAWS